LYLITPKLNVIIAISSHTHTHTHKHPTQTPWSYLISKYYFICPRFFWICAISTPKYVKWQISFYFFTMCMLTSVCMARRKARKCVEIIFSYFKWQIFYIFNYWKIYTKNTM